MSELEGLPFEKDIKKAPPGEALDALVHRWVFGRKDGSPPAYSTNTDLAFHLVRRTVHMRGWNKTTLTPPAHKQCWYQVHAVRDDLRLESDKDPDKHIYVEGESIAHVDCKLALVVAVRLLRAHQAILISNISRLGAESLPRSP